MHTERTLQRFDSKQTAVTVPLIAAAIPQKHQWQNTKKGVHDWKWNIQVKVKKNTYHYQHTEEEIENQLPHTCQQQGLSWKVDFYQHCPGAGNNPDWTVERINEGLPQETANEDVNGSRITRFPNLNNLTAVQVYESHGRRQGR